MKAENKEVTEAVTEEVAVSATEEVVEPTTKDVEIDVEINGTRYKGTVSISLDDCHDINLHSLLDDYDLYAEWEGRRVCKVCHILAGEALWKAGEGFDEDIEECRDESFSQNEEGGKHDSEGQVHQKGKRVDAVHLIVFFGTQILRDYNRYCCRDDVEHDDEKEHYLIGIADCSDGILRIAAQHQSVHIVKKDVQEQLQEHRYGNYEQ